MCSFQVLSLTHTCAKVSTQHCDDVSLEASSWVLPALPSRSPGQQGLTKAEAEPGKGRRNSRFLNVLQPSPLLATLLSSPWRAQMVHIQSLKASAEHSGRMCSFFRTVTLLYCRGSLQAGDKWKQLWLGSVKHFCECRGEGLWRWLSGGRGGEG